MARAVRDWSGRDQRGPIQYHRYRRGRRDRQSGVSRQWGSPGAELSMCPTASVGPSVPCQARRNDVLPAASLWLTGNGSRVLDGRTLNNRGTAHVGGALGTISLNRGTFKNDTGALFDISADTSIDDSDGAVTTSLFVNAGTLRCSGTSGRCGDQYRAADAIAAQSRCFPGRSNWRPLHPRRGVRPDQRHLEPRRRRSLLRHVQLRFGVQLVPLEAISPSTQARHLWEVGW